MNLDFSLKTQNRRVSLNWSQLNAVIDGVSAIDLGSLAIRTRSDAARFALEYGFDIDNVLELERIRRAHEEAIAFIEDIFLTEDQAHLISEKVRHPDHVLDLLVYSSNYLNKSNLTQLWACAVLKVMHGIFHIDHDFKLKYFDTIRSQVFESIDKLITKSDNGHYLSDGVMKIPLFFFEKKRNKGRKSVLLKLLQKPSYVAADIYDHLGIRLIFETKAECLFALKLLRRAHLISVTNIKPSRTRNTLVDLQRAKEVFNRFRAPLQHIENYPLDLLQRMDKAMEAGSTNPGKNENPHSSSDYQAIQVTARKMVRVPNPFFLQMSDALSTEERDIYLPGLKADSEMARDIGFYFDYEIQLTDRKSYVKTLHGPASHKAYKLRQRQTARKRVLGPTLLRYLETECPKQEEVDVGG